jgi:glycine C-acetyltransferase/8-amino-7-oxononanoate synthase
VQRLATNARALRGGLEAEGFVVGESRTHILPLVVGDAGQAMRVCEIALQRGVFAQAIRPPTVPPLTSRLRLTVMATHREGELLAAARTFAVAARVAGFDPRSQASVHAGGVAEALDPEPVHARALSAPPPVARAGVFDFEASGPARRAA